MTEAPAPSAKCLFCGVSEDLADLSDEDVTPRWLLHELSLPSHDKTFHGIWNSATGELIDRKTESTWKVVEPRVCRKACNNGWMSRLEKAAQELLPALTRGERDVSSLAISERRLLAKWAAKTAYMHSSAGLLGRPVQAAHIQSLNGDLGFLAPRVVVFASQGLHTRPSSYVQTGLWPQQTLLRPGSQSPLEAYKIGLQYQQLALLVAYWPNPVVQLMPAPYHFPVWTDGWLMRPWKGLVYERPGEPLLTFANDLGVFDPPKVLVPGGMLR